MKKWITALTLAAVTAFALPNNETQLVMLAQMAQKKAIVLATMNLDGEKKAAFGKLYDEYQEKMAKVLGDKLHIIVEYAKNYNHLDDATAQKLMKQWFTVKKEALTLQQEYAKKFGKILSPAEVIRYMQIENKFHIMREAEISDMVPLAQPPKALPMEEKK
jgi:polysaccharide pyruvyl transferase WcaK-like protein